MQGVDPGFSGKGVYMCKGGFISLFLKKIFHENEIRGVIRKFAEKCY